MQGALTRSNLSILIAYTYHLEVIMVSVCTYVSVIIHFMHTHSNIISTYLYVCNLNRKLQDMYKLWNKNPEFKA